MHVCTLCVCLLGFVRGFCDLVCGGLVSRAQNVESATCLFFFCWALRRELRAKLDFDAASRESCD